MVGSLASSPNTYRLTIPRIRLGEFDIGGVLYHAHYFHLYEAAREALLEDGGLPYSRLVESGAHLAIIQSKQQFSLPVFYGRPIEIITGVTRLYRTSVTFDYAILDQQARKNPVHTASTTHVYVKKSGEGFRPAPLPQEIFRILEGHRYSANV